MKTLENPFSLWSNIFLLLAGSLATNANAAVFASPQVQRTSVPQKLLYKINSDSLESLKESLVQVNLHMRQNAKKIRPRIRLALFGEGVSWLTKGRVDAELENMLEWFRDRQVQIGVDAGWLSKLEIQDSELSPGMVIMHFQSSPPKED